VVFIIVAVALMPLAGVQLTSRRAVDEAQRYGEAVEVAQARLEQLRATGFGNAVSDSTSQGPFNVLTTVQAQLDPNTGIASTELERLNVTVRWVEKGDTLSVALTGLRADRR
jgi:Tfp pilus assembly protein PilV